MSRSARVMALCIIFAIGGELRGEFFDDAKAECLGVLQKIQKHPFITKLANGTLSKNRFCYYLAQDDVYLDSYARALFGLGAKSDRASQMLLTLNTALATIDSEKDSVHRQYETTICTEVENRRTPALFAYENFLLATSALQPFAVGFSSTIPCDWIYREVGRWLAHKSAKNNPYALWIKYYSSTNSNDDNIRILNALAHDASAAEREKMLAAFRMSCELELKFWDDAYFLRAWP